MAGTYTPNDAITMAKQMAHRIPSETIQAYACDIVNSMIWTKHTWNWTLGTLTAITCVDGTQDYAIANADFYRVAWLRLARTDLTPVAYKDLYQKKHIGVEATRKGGAESINVFSYEGAISKIRLELAASVASGTTLQIQGEYQKQPTKITAATMGTALTHPDHYFNVFLEGVRWKLYELSDDPRAGVMKIDSEGNRGYSGKLGDFMDGLFSMQQAEDLSDGEDSAYPESTLGPSSGSYQPTIF